MSRERALLSLLACSLGLGCSADADPEDGPLMLVEAWAPSTTDPFPDHRPATVSCPDASWQLEEGSIEVDTGECNYLSLEQPLLRDVDEGTPLIINMWHQALFDEVGGLAHLALVIGDEVIWEQYIDVPGPAQIWREQITAPRDLLRDEPVVVHLHNHGANSWNLGELEPGSDPTN